MSRSREETRPSVISSIFGVVGRELQQFVLSAAGVNPAIETTMTHPNSPKKVRTKRKAPPVQQGEESDHRRPRKRARTSSPEIMMQERRSQASPEEDQPVVYTCPEYADKSDIDSQDRTPSPPPVRRRAMSRMPGALYDLSSPEPESQEGRRVRFASDVIGPPLQRPSSSRSPEREREGERERLKSRVTSEIPLRLRHRNLQPLASQYSDASYASPPPSTTDSEDIAMSQESSLEPPIRFPSLVGSSLYKPQQPSSFPSGSLPTHSRTSSLTSQPFDREIVRPGRILRDGSFTSASERSVEQERISALEEEVRKLKEELSRRPSTAPPPPPPPPPPMLQAGRIPTVAREKGANSVLESARASLKATPGLTQPTVNPSANMKSTVPAAQMAAFLNEMRAVRLRKVSSKPDMGEGSSSRGPVPLKSSVLDKLGSSSSFSIPRQRHALSQDSVSTQSVGSSFAASDLSIPSFQTSTNTTKRLSEPQNSRVVEPTPSLVSDNGDPVDEEFPPSTPPSTSHLPPAAVRRDHHSIPVSTSTIPNSKTSGTTQTIDPTSDRYAPHANNNAASTSRDNGSASTRDVRASAFPNRPMNSGPLPSLSPEKPRPPGRSRLSNSGGTKRVERRMSVYSGDEEDPLSLLTPRRHQQQHTEYSIPIRDDTNRRSRSTHRSPAPSFSRSRSRSQSRPREPTPSASISGNVPSLEAELRKVVRAEVEREFEREIQELDARAGEVLSGTGLRDSQKDGFMAGGGAGGEPVLMRNGIEDREELEREQRVGNGRSSKSRHRA